MDVLKWKFDHAKLSKYWPREGKLKELDTSINHNFNSDYGINLKFSICITTNRIQLIKKK